MRYFEYNNEIINLSQVTNFTCLKSHMPYQGESENFILLTHLGYSHGNSEKEEQTYDACIKLGEFKERADGLQVVRNIIAGKYDVPTSADAVTEDVAPIEPANEYENEATPTETETETTPPETETETTEEQQPTDDPEAKEKIIESARELFKQQQTKVIAGELGIETLKIYAEAERTWGDSDKWTIQDWETYIQALADFQQREGELYNKLKPQTESQPQTNGNENGNSKNGKGPF